MKKFVFIAFLGLATLAFTAMDMQIAASPPNTPVETYDVSPNYAHYTAVVTAPAEVAKARIIVQDAPQVVSHSVNANPIQSVEKTHRARYDIDDCLSSIVIFPNGRCITSYDLRQKSTKSLFSFLYRQNTTPISIRRVLLS